MTPQRQNKKPVIVVVAYNRTGSLRRLLNSIDKAYYEWSDIPLVISIDKSDNREVKTMAEQFEWKHGTKDAPPDPKAAGY